MLVVFQRCQRWLQDNHFVFSSLYGILTPTTIFHLVADHLGPTFPSINTKIKELLWRTMMNLLLFSRSHARCCYSQSDFYSSIILFPLQVGKRLIHFYLKYKYMYIIIIYLSINTCIFRMSCFFIIIKWWLIYHIIVKLMIIMKL